VTIGAANLQRGFDHRGSRVLLRAKPRRGRATIISNRFNPIDHPVDFGFIHRRIPEGVPQIRDHGVDVMLKFLQNDLALSATAYMSRDSIRRHKSDSAGGEIGKLPPGGASRLRRRFLASHCGSDTYLGKQSYLR
jgi:hypothetical protein